MGFQGIIIRCNPGQIDAIEAGGQAKFDAAASNGKITRAQFLSAAGDSLPSFPCLYPMLVMRWSAFEKLEALPRSDEAELTTAGAYLTFTLPYLYLT